MYIPYILQLTLIEAMTSISVSQNPGICSNVSDGEPFECCPNYRLIGTSCKECFAGSRGVNCAEDCAKGFYGRLCREECSCDPCDKVYGCQNVPNDYTHNVSAECPSGSQGVDCKEDCAPGFYGRLCREECACDQCDKVYGCQNVTTEYTHNRSTGIYIFLIPVKV